MRKEFWLLGDQGSIDVNDPTLKLLNFSRGFFKENAAGRAFPPGIGVGKKVADVRLANGAQEGITNGVHQDVGIGVTLQTFAMGDFDSTEDEFSTHDQRMNVVPNTHMNHRANIGRAGKPTKIIFYFLLATKSAVAFFDETGITGMRMSCPRISRITRR